MLLVGAYVHQNFVFDTFCGIGGELTAFVRFERFYAFYQSDTAYADKIVRFAGVVVLFYYVRDESEVVFYECLFL